MMENKDHCFYAEYFLTFLLFVPLLLLFPQEVVPLRIFIIGGMILGAAVAYSSREKFITLRKFATLAASLLILAGAVYFVLKSTFLYREVIIICIKGLSLLLVVNCFSSCFQGGYLGSMQIFSILLFFCICALNRGYNNLFLILSAGFIFNFLAIIRIKFYSIFNASAQAKTKWQGINVLFVIVLVVAAILSWVLFMNVPLGRIKAWGYLKEEDLSLMNEREKVKDAFLQEEQIQKELTKMTFKLSSTDEMHQVIASIQDLLIKEKPFAHEVDKAKKDVLEMVNNPELAQEATKKKKLNDSIENYVEKKISKNLNQIKSQMDKAIQDNHLGLRQRFAILSTVNKIEYSESYEEIDKLSEQLRSAFNDESVSDEAKKELKQLAKQLKEWKAYQVYTDKFDSFQEKISTLNEEKKQDFEDLAEQISQSSSISEANAVDKSIEEMRKVSFTEDDKYIDEAAQLLKLKKVILAAKESSQLRQKLEDSGQSVDRPPELEDALNAVEESRDPQEIVKKIFKLIQRMRQERDLQVSAEAKAILQAKLESLIKEAVEVLKKQIQESNLSNSQEILFAALKEMEQARSEDKIISQAALMQEAIEKFYKRGSITKENRDNLINQTQEVEQLLKAKLELVDMGKPEKLLDKEAQSDYQEKLAKLLLNSSLDDEQKDQLNKLMEKLIAAKEVAQVQDVLYAATDQLEVMTKKENAREINKIKELMQQAADEKKMFIVEKQSNSLRENMEDLKDVRPEQTALLEDNLDKIRESKNRQDLLTNTQALEELSVSEQFEKKIKQDEVEVAENAKLIERLEIFLLPNYAVLSVQSSMALKSITIYDSFIKEIGLEMEWFSSDPAVALVDQSGVVLAKAPGETEITSRYRGTVSSNCKVTVVGMVSEPEAAMIKNELGK